MKEGHILITGVGRRAGLHLARRYLQAGQPIIGTYRSEHAELQELAEQGAELHRCDFHSRPEVEGLIDTIKAGHRSLRGIIHNASQWLSDRAEMPPHRVIEAMMRVHVNVPYELNQALAPLLQAHDGPHADIIHVGDHVSSRGSKKHMAYAASKAAQDNLTLSFAQLLAPKIKVNSIAPALLLFNEHDDNAYREKALNKSLLQREAGFGELEDAINYLMGSQYVTGCILPLNGGRHLR